MITRLYHISYKFFCLCLFFVGITSCKKLIEVDLPIDSNTAESVYSNTGTASAALSGIYFSLANPGGHGQPLTGESGISFKCGLTADELKQFSQFGNPLYSNSYIGDASGIWNILYSSYLYNTNSVIEGVSTSSGISDASKQVLLGEAKFMRAFFYFYLVNLYGDIPLVTGTDFTVNSKVSRTSITAVYEQIIADLLAAQQGLTDNYLKADLISLSSERVRPNKAAATALLARLYLYTNQWQKAEAEATKIISNPSYSLLPNLNAVFLKNSRESIWQVQTSPNVVAPRVSPNTLDGIDFIPEAGNIPDVSLSDHLLNNFEANDKRRSAWVTEISDGTDLYFIPYKYKAGPENTTQTEYQMVLRLAEQYLIRAEARAWQDKLIGTGSAKEDLDIVRNRAGLGGTSASTRTAILDAIAKERQVELFTEWGDRWLNLKRTGKIDEVMSIVTPLKGGSWASFKALFAVPLQEIKLNPNLLPQNSGYPSSF